MTDQESYAQKIAKLLRKAEDKNISAEEAEAFFSKAQELMAKYQIDEAMLAAARGFDQKQDAIVHEEFVLTGSYRVALGNLTSAIIRHNGGQVVLLGDPGWRKVGDKVFKQCYVLVATGFKKDIDQIRLLDASLQIQAATAMTKFWNEHRDLYGDRDGFLARRQFLFSFASEVNAKLAAAAARGRVQAEQEHGSDSVALVLRDKNALVLAAYQEKWPRLKDVKSRQTAGDRWAAEQGREAGRRADIGGTRLGGSRKSIGS